MGFWAQALALVSCLGLGSMAYVGLGVFIRGLGFQVLALVLGITLRACIISGLLSGLVGVLEEVNLVQGVGV